MTRITLPDCVVKIGDGAFRGCTALASAALPAGLTEISEYLFWNCTSLSSVSIPDGVTEIGSYAFSCCTNLTTIRVPNSVTSVGIDAFGDTPWLRQQGEFPVINGILLAYQGEDRHVVIPQNVTQINTHAFYYNKNLASASVPNGVAEIGDCAFQGCASLTDAAIPDGVTEIGGSAFYMCENLADVNVPRTVTRIGEYAFSCAAGGGDGWFNYYVPGNLTIFGETGSYAEAYARENRIPFAAGKALAFSDLYSWCATEAEWAAAKGIAKGTGGGRFGPQSVCRRGEIVTFLYRAYSK